MLVLPIGKNYFFTVGKEITIRVNIDFPFAIVRIEAPLNNEIRKGEERELIDRTSDFISIIREKHEKIIINEEIEIIITDITKDKAYFGIVSANGFLVHRKPILNYKI